MQKDIDESATGLSSNAAAVYLRYYITEFGVLKRLLDRAQHDPRFIIHNVPVINNLGEVTWPAKYALTDEDATAKVSSER